MRSKKFWHFKSIFLFPLITFPVSAWGMKASVHLLASQLMRSWNRSVLLCFPLAHHAAFSLESGHRVKMRKGECKTHLCACWLFWADRSWTGFFSTQSFPCVRSKFCFFGTFRRGGQCAVHRQNVLANFCQAPQNADINLSEIVSAPCLVLRTSVTFSICVPTITQS